ncbi:VOC family protein [Neobacillus sp. YIM B06451]|uniref:VOC family protein n=1 Tax=Neobacillus sp. YIM B06451 TaxID=3070994 RepID=UPI0029306FE3|nr:VOC family protein [Neobacillus sp. YIM B06451]
MVEFHHYAIETNLLEEVAEFYKTALGFRDEKTIEFHGKKLIFLTLGVFRIELIEGDEPIQGNDSIHLCFQVGALDSIIKTVERAGLVKAEGPFTMENGWRSVFYTGIAGETLEFLEQR